MCIRTCAYDVLTERPLQSGRDGPQPRLQIRPKHPRIVPPEDASHVFPAEILPQQRVRQFRQTRHERKVDAPTICAMPAAIAGRSGNIEAGGQMPITSPVPATARARSGEIRRLCGRSRASWIQ